MLPASCRQFPHGQAPVVYGQGLAQVKAMLASVPPRFSHPYGAYHVNGHPVPCGNFFPPLSTLFCVPNIFGGINRQFVRFAKFIQSVFGISPARHILQIFRFVVMLVTVLMVYMATRRTMAYKCGCNHRVNGFVGMLAADGQCDKQIAVSPTSGSQDIVFSGLVRNAPKNFAYDWLTHAYYWRNFSGAMAFLTQAVNQCYLVFRKRSLAEIERAKASHFAFGTNFVGIFKPVHGCPSFHMKTPNS